MNKYYHNLNYNERVYQPIAQKTFKNALQQFFKNEVPQIGGDMIIELISDKIQTLVDTFYPKTERLSMGQMLWFAIDEKESPSYGKSITKTKIKPVILTVVHPDDIKALKNNCSILTIKDQIMARLYKETKEQGAVLAESDISLIMHMTCMTVSKRTTAYEKTYQLTLPRRGTIHDLGRSLSHKRVICKKRHLENKSISQIARETDHTPQAITRYTTDLNRVQFCLNKKLSIKDISFVTNLSPDLTIEYITLIDEIKQKQKEQLDEQLPF
jgi:hypothetical protein